MKAVTKDSVRQIRFNEQSFKNEMKNGGKEVDELGGGWI